jgi:hypothetical protein
VFSAEASAEGVVLLGDDDDLDGLMGYVAAEANHEPDQRRQRRLDDVFEILTRAIETPRGR